MSSHTDAMLPQVRRTLSHSVHCAAACSRLQTSPIIVLGRKGKRTLSRHGRTHLSFVYSSVVFPGELLRKKRREKDGHKDPLLQEISHLQEEVMNQISNLRKEHEAAEKKRSEIEKVALILGLTPSDRPRRISKTAEEKEDGMPPPGKEKHPEGRQEVSSSIKKVGTPAEEVQ